MEEALELRDVFRRQRDGILRAIPRGTKYRTDFLAEVIAGWANAKSANIAVVSNYLLERGRGSIARKEFLVDLIVFRKGAVRPWISAEFEWSSARTDRKERRQTLLLERTPAGSSGSFVDQAHKDRAFDLLKVFLTRPELGVFGGWENSRRGGVTSVDELIDRDSWFIQGFARASTGEGFPLIYLAAVRLARSKGFDFTPALFLPENGRLSLVQ